jgi:hypothetical protein
MKSRIAATIEKGVACEPKWIRVFGAGEFFEMMWHESEPLRSNIVGYALPGLSLLAKIRNLS